MIARLSASAALTAFLLLDGMQPRLSAAPAVPSAGATAACRAEDQKLSGLLQGVRVELVGPARRQTDEPFELRFTGIVAFNQPGLVVRVVTILPAAVVVEQLPEWSAIETPEVSLTQYRSDRRRMLYPLGSSAKEGATLVLSAAHTGAIELESVLVAQTACGERAVRALDRFVVTIEPNNRDAEIAAAGPAQCAKEVEILRRSRRRRRGHDRPGNPPSRPASPSASRGGAGLTASLEPTGPPRLRDAGRRPVFTGGHILPIPPGGPGAVRHRVRCKPAPGLPSARPTRGSRERWVHARGPSHRAVRHRVGGRCQDGLRRDRAGRDRHDADRDRARHPAPARAGLLLLRAAGSERDLADGRYRLDIFKASYRVYDVSTGVKIVDRAGRHPNFSPAARYVAAYALGSESAGGTMELIDLVTGAPIPDLAVTGPILAWALGDALLIEGTIGHPEIRIRRSLVNPTFRKPDAEPGQREEIGLIEMSTSGRGDSAWGRYRIKLLLDQSLALIESYQLPATKTNFAGIYELAAGRIIGERGDLTPEARRAALASYGLDDAALANRWDLGEPLQLSHHSPQADAVFGEPAQNAKGSKAQAPRLPKQRSFLALHRNN